MVFHSLAIGFSTLDSACSASQEETKTTKPAKSEGVEAKSSKARGRCGKTWLVDEQCQPWINQPLGCLIGRVPFQYWIMTIGGVPPN